MKGFKKFLPLFLAFFFNYIAQAQCTIEDLNSFSVEQVDAECATTAALRVRYKGSHDCFDNLTVMVVDAARKSQGKIDPLEYHFDKDDIALFNISYGEYTIYLKYQGLDEKTFDVRTGMAETRYTKPILDLVRVTKPNKCEGSSLGSKIEVKLREGTADNSGLLTYEIGTYQDGTVFTPIAEKTVGPTSEREASFSDLPVGEYRVRVRQRLGALSRWSRFKGGHA